MSDTNTVTKSTLYIAVAVSLIAGFLGGVVYTIYNAPASAPATVQSQPGTNTQPSKAVLLEQEVKKNPENAVSWANLGHAYFDSNQVSQAITAYNKSLELLPGNPDLLTDLGVMYRRNSQPQQAVEAFDRAIKENPKHEQARFNKGVVLLNDLHNHDGAVKVWEELIQLNPNVTLPSGAPLKELIEKIKAKGQQN
jgi:cytochrome c-type biogenesis protein CcmH/NrfG